jgi:flagellar biosynthesis protein
MMAKRKAIALSYTDTLTAPVIIAQGRSELAEKMLGIAGKYGIQVVSDPVLADILSDAEIGSCIPVETYEAVASIFAFLEKGIREEWFSKS